ncbi:MAG: hypothetical protein ACJAT1_002491, partial [Marivirga sp.]
FFSQEKIPVRIIPKVLLTSSTSFRIKLIPLGN